MALFQYLPLSPQEYEGSITLHGIRDLFGFAQQLIFAIFFYFTFKMLNVQPRLSGSLTSVSFCLTSPSCYLRAL